MTPNTLSYCLPNFGHEFQLKTLRDSMLIEIKLTLCGLYHPALDRFRDCFYQRLTPFLRRVCSRYKVLSDVAAEPFRFQHPSRGNKWAVLCD